MTWVNVSVPAERKAWRPGEALEVRAEWELEAGAGPLQLRLCWKTSSPTSSPEPVVVKTESVDVPEAKGERALRMDLPDGPWSFIGKLFELEWYVELESADGISRKAEFVLSPTDGPLRTRPESDST